MAEDSPDDRANIKCDRETFDRLAALKGETETWDGFLRRAADALDTEIVERVPRCASCQNRVDDYTVQDGELLCTMCAQGEFR